jgi:hypothetical protein
VNTPNFGLWYPKGASFDLVGYSDLDWAGDKVERKSTSGSCQFLGRSLVCWSSKKQKCVSLSTTEAEYVAAASCCAQILWMRQTLKDYGVIFDKVPLLCDNESAIKIAHCRGFVNRSAIEVGVWRFVDGGEHGGAIQDGGSTSLPSFRSRNGGETLRAAIIHYMATSARLQ